MRLQLLISALCASLLGCQTTGPNNYAQQAEHQFGYAKDIARDYERCIGRASVPQPGINPREQLRIAQQNCEEYATRYTVVLEQAYTNECLAAGRGDLKSCDAISVSRAAEDYQQLKRRADSKPIKPLAAPATKPRQFNPLQLELFNR